MANIYAQDALGIGLYVNSRADLLERVEIVYPQVDRMTVPLYKLTSQASADTNIAVVIDDTVEEIPGCSGAHAGQRGGQRRGWTGIVVGGLFHVDDP